MNNEIILRLSEQQATFLVLQRQRVLGMIGALESTVVVLRAEAELLDRFLTSVGEKPSESETRKEATR